MAANPAELNFGLFGPRYDGRVPNASGHSGSPPPFPDKESTFWNSSLQITGFANVHEIAYRPWQSDNIPRRYCTATATLSDGASSAELLDHRGRRLGELGRRR